MTTAAAGADPDVTKIVHRYAPRGTAKAVLKTRVREVVISGPAGTGKSHGALFKILLAALKYPGMRALICRQVADSLTDSTMVEWRDTVAAAAIASGECWFYSGSRTEAAGYKFSNGSKISIGGLDKPSKIMSRQYDLIFVDEATETTPKAWQALITRLRHGRMPYRQIIGACNPDAPTHWIQKRVTLGLTTLMYAHHWENPRWYDDCGPAPDTVPDDLDETYEVHEGRLYRITPSGVQYIDDTLGALTGIDRLRLKDGIWAAAEGVIYTDWNPKTHVVDPYPIPADWPRFWVIDFGFRNPFVCQWWAESPDGQLVMYREIYMSGVIVEDHARHMLRLVTEPTPDMPITPDQLAADELDPKTAIAEGRRVWTEPQPIKIICDHDAEDRATLQRHLGHSTAKARKEVKRGIGAVKARLRVDKRGIPGLVLFTGALVERDEALDKLGLPACTAEEPPQYIWEPAKPGEQPKEEPRKENDHGCDCKRYLVADRDLRVRISDRDPWL